MVNKLLISLGAAALLLGTSAVAGEHKKEEAKEHGEKKAAHWDYDKHGPSCWGDFSTVCSEGKKQSPINIVTKETIPLDGDAVLKLDQDYCAESKVEDNGHSIKVSLEEAGSVTAGCVDYKLLQFHFHGHSEHTVDGKQYDLVAHLVHKSSEGDLAVVGVLFEEGEANPFLDKVIKNVGKNAMLNVAEMLPEDTEHYYHYQGSLTTPPCSEGVQWYVLKQPVTASKEQLAAFRKYYENNYRPVQPLNDRKVQAR